jgi:glutathione S-transferase
MSAIVLHDYELSAECYAVRLLLSFLGVEHERRPVDVYPGTEHEGPAFRRMSPLARVPVLEADGVVMWDWVAILTFLASTRDPARTWLPEGDAAQSALLAQWLGVARELEGSAGLARLSVSMFVEADVEACRGRAHTLLRMIDEHLWFQERQGRSWMLDGPRPSLADLAPFPSIMLCEEAGVDRRHYPAIRRWADRFRRTPGFTVMSGVFPAAPAA